MKIIYNPPDGAPIQGFNFQGHIVNPFYPSGAMTPNNTVSKGLMQFEDAMADALLSTFGFLQEYTKDQAEKALKEPDAKIFMCDFPGCGKTFAKEIGLLGHSRSHKKDLERMGTPVVDPSIIPVAGSKEVESVFDTVKKDEPIIPNGADKDGVEWYGEDLQVENKSTQIQQDFSGAPIPGKAHFKG